MFKFAILDPRSAPAAVEANDKVFSTVVYGIEVTVPALVARCAHNIDPQHGAAGGADLAAIEAVRLLIAKYEKGRPCCGGSWDTYSCPKCDGSDCPPPIPKDGETLATVRADLDSVGAMAILSLWLKGGNFHPALVARVYFVAEADRFARGGYSGPKPLPTKDVPWPEGGSAESSKPLAAIAAAVADFKVPLETRVATMEQWLLTGDEPTQYRTVVEKERLDLITALEGGQIKCRIHKAGYWYDSQSGVSSPTAQGGSEWISQGNIALVESTHRAATLVGYCLAPVIVALNPSFRFQGGDPHKKFTVCQYTAEYVDLKAALADLQKLEAGWGGSPTIIGSPQGIGSTLTLEQVTEVVARHLKK